MNMKETWHAKRSFYEQLSFPRDGDVLEKIAAIHHGLLQRFPNYQTFWKFVICPSSERPTKAIGFRDGVSKEVKRISQVSYSILQNLIQADGFAYRINHLDFGFMNLNIQECLIFSGNALQLLHELKIMVEERLGKVLANKKIKAFEDENEFKDQKTKLSRYRNYLTHSGLIMTYPMPGNPNLPAILKPEKLISIGDNPTVWDYMDQSTMNLENDLVPLHSAVLNVNEETWLFINSCYGKFFNTLEGYFETIEMQRAWGWDPSI